ncbi:RNA-binding protein [Elioraea sp.]|uniref:RNA-binding protein n=1 Tax=Elioraea sp. TaxID=2185103 RepID=UPI003F6F916B
MLAAPDAAAEEPETGPTRRCVLTGARQAKEAMIRFVVGPDGQVVPDLAARLPGRGMWLSAQGSVLEDRRLGQSFARAAKARVTVPDDLRPRLVAGLERRVADLLGLARRAGQAVAGFVVARDWVASGRAGLVVEARDGAPDGRRKLLAGASVPVVAPLTAAELGAVFARDHVVHVAIMPGRLARAIATETSRLAGVRGDAQSTDDGNGTG